jgi:hypothetical protein
VRLVEHKPARQLGIDLLVDTDRIGLAQRALAEHESTEQRHDRHRGDRKDDLAFEAPYSHGASSTSCDRSLSTRSAAPMRSLTNRLTNEPKKDLPSTL